MTSVSVMESQYLYRALIPNQRRKILRDMTKELRRHEKKFETIVCTGLSGTLIAPSLADRLKKSLVVLRKGESSHGVDIEWTSDNPPIRNFIIVDDVVSTGETVQRILEEIRAHWPKATCKGILLWRNVRDPQYVRKITGIKVLNHSTTDNW